ncbi:hypothetical protein C8R46DRAFT_847223, partial [Mycena filopes]
LLLWVANSPSPQEIRDRIVGGDSRFRKKMIAYLEACHQAEFITGSEQEVRDNVRLYPIGTPPEKCLPPKPGYVNPTLALPTPPPRLCKNSHCPGFCAVCRRSCRWLAKYASEVDDLILRSNLH